MAPSTVPVPGGRLAVRSLGGGAPLVLLHGGMGTSTHDWGEVAPRLASRWRVTLVDWKAHGASPPGDRRIGVERYALDLAHVLRWLGDVAPVLIGFSLGANAVLHLLAMRPEAARAAVLVGGSAIGDPDRIRRQAARPWPQELLGLHAAAAAGDDGYTTWLRHTLIADWAAHCRMPDAALARITCPVLVCQGHRDRVQPLDAAFDLARRLPDAQHLVVPDAGHAVQLDRPALWLAAVERFLDDVCAVSPAPATPAAPPAAARAASA